ncbi:hypothetical protein [Paucidesulfovibrio longus]|uniref:hypothetical protein n=1 Tax=Paucidesulfovibrio longus TaxID=889 RepID=UPI0003B430FB|nr:hypothetical protein [Paucidesulfovibrio longus]
MDFSELDELAERAARLSGLAQARHEEFVRARRELCGVESFLALAPQAAKTLEELSSALFGEVLDEIEANLTHAIREVLGQDRTVTSERSTKNNKLQVHFSIYSGGDEERQEDILSGQGGSVANILSVGLRLIALSQLDPRRHRPFLVLDEQDCWLKPELVPRFMKLIAQIARRLELQLLVISHHPVDAFASAADRVCQLSPDAETGPRLSVTRIRGVEDADGRAEPDAPDGE